MLKRLWNFLFDACKHQWKTVEKYDLIEYEEYHPYQKTTIGTKYILQCKNCGCMKAKSL